jgi:hypothetical protein
VAKTRQMNIILLSFITDWVSHMSGFAGLCNYTTNFLYDIPRITAYLWEMAGKIGNGCRYGIDVVEHNGAFVQNSVFPLSGSDYYFKYNDNSFYYFWNGAATFPHGGVFFHPDKKRLLLFRNTCGAPVYYANTTENGLVFGSSSEAIDILINRDKQKTLESGKAIIYDPQGFVIKDLNLISHNFQCSDLPYI